MVQPLLTYAKNPDSDSYSYQCECSFSWVVFIQLPRRKLCFYLCFIRCCIWTAFTQGVSYEFSCIFKGRPCKNTYLSSSDLQVDTLGHKCLHVVSSICWFL